MVPIRYLADHEYSAENIAWCEKHGIRICHIRMQSAKEPFIENDPDLVALALAQVLDTRNYPLLIHSNKGKHRWYVLLSHSALTLTCLIVVSLSDVSERCKDGVLPVYLTSMIGMRKERGKVTSNLSRGLIGRLTLIPCISQIGCHCNLKYIIYSPSLLKPSYAYGYKKLLTLSNLRFK